MPMTITIEIDPNNLSGCEDSHLATLWHLAQANPADGFESSEPGELAAKIGLEIIQRWLRATPPEMFHHQDRHYYWHQLARFARFRNGQWEPRIEGEG